MIKVACCCENLKNSILSTKLYNEGKYWAFLISLNFHEDKGGLCANSFWFHMIYFLNKVCPCSLTFIIRKIFYNLYRRLNNNCLILKSVKNHNNIYEINIYCSLRIKFLSFLEMPKKRCQNIYNQNADSTIAGIIPIGEESL